MIHFQHVAPINMRCYLARISQLDVVRIEHGGGLLRLIRELTETCFWYNLIVRARSRRRCAQQIAMASRE